MDGKHAIAFAIAPSGKTTPDELIATIRVDDPSGVFYGAIERRRFVATSGTDADAWAIASTEVDAAVIEDHGLVLAETWELDDLEVEAPPWLDPPTASLASAPAGTKASSFSGGGGESLMSTCSGVWRYVYGKIGFWDIRDTKADGAGARHPTCDTSDTTCAIDSADCCFRSVKDARAHLYSFDDSAFITQSGTSGDGSYFLYDPCWEPNKDYRIYIQPTTHANAWGDWRVMNSSGATQASLFGLVTFDMDGGVLTSLSVSVNQPANPNTLVGETTNLFMGIQRTMAAMNAVEDNRLRFGPTGTTNQLIKVRYYGAGTGFNCGTDEIFVPSGHAGAQTPIWLLGYLYNARVTGCSGTRPAYPPYLGGEYSWTTGEGNSLVAAIPATLLTVSYWDPQVATNTSVFNNLWPCFFDSFSNTNRASSERNNFLAIWEFIDTDTGNTSGAGSDELDLTLGEMMDGLKSLRDEAGSPGDNGTNAEAVWVWVSTPPCSNSEQCSAGHICRADSCYTGSPHGENIRDWVEHVYIELGGTYADYENTLDSSLCLGAPENSYPYTGGYRDDGY